MLMMKELVPAVAPAAAPSTAEERKRAAGLTPLLVTVVEAKNLPLKDVSSKTDPFVTVEAAGIKSQTDVQRGTCNPVWEQVLTLRCVFVPGTREELVISCWHEDVFEDELIVLLASARSSKLDRCTYPVAMFSECATLASKMIQLPRLASSDHPAMT